MSFFLFFSFLFFKPRDVLCVLTNTVFFFCFLFGKQDRITKKELGRRKNNGGKPSSALLKKIKPGESKRAKVEGDEVEEEESSAAVVE